ncbi:MAG: asparaginase [Mycobacteriaceae bacterium]
MHRGSLVVLADDGAVELALGEVDVPMFPRSSNKPMQAVAMLRSGFSPSGTEQLALAAASHSGEDTHVQAVLGLLAAAGLGEQDLACPADLPGHEPSRDAVLAAGGSRRRVYMNCSGKHAAMLSTCVAAGWPTTGYTDAGHQLQLAGRATVAELAGEDVSALGVDGCGAPIFALTLTGLARSFARLVLARPDSPERRVADAMRAHPFLVSGTGREDLLLMGAVPGLLCKAGAEGVHVGALADGRAFAVKIDDGAARARGPVTVGVLDRWGIDVSGLDALAAEPLLGGGAVVGAARLLPGVF